MRSTSSYRALTRLSVIVTPATLVVLTTDLPAHALPSAEVSINYTSSAHTVCADGSGPAGTQWQFSVIGARSATVSPLIEAVFPTTTAAIYHQCYTVQKYGSDVGDYVGTLVSYSGTSDLPSVAVGNGTWLLGSDQHISTGG